MVPCQGALLLLVACLVLPAVHSQEAAAKAFLDAYNREVPTKTYASSQAAWLHATNLTEHNKNVSVEESLKWSLYAKELRANASKISRTGVSADYNRQLDFLVKTASSPNAGIRKRLSIVSSTMEDIYSRGCVTATNKDVKVVDIPEGTSKCLSLDPDLTRILRNSTDPNELLFAWKGWRDAVGPKIRPLYKEFVNLANQGARQNGWADYGEWFRSWYEVKDLQTMTESVWDDIKPFYNELHAYVRYKLAQRYPSLVKDGEPIPAHLLGNMWSQSWGNIYNLAVPYPAEPSLDVTEKLKSKLKTAEGMFQEAENFFVSIGWPKLPASFWTKSMLTKPANRSVVCHASAWDFSINQDVRVKMCTSMNQDDFTTIHHELGHIYYYLLYWNQPFEYRTGANPGFHEAVGDVMALSVQTPKHLNKIGLLDALPNNSKSDMNFLLQMALEKIAFIPFGYLVDQWRWKVLKGDTTTANYNKEWWSLRTKYQGIKAPDCRSENDFDPGTKYHIPANTPYIRYFISHIIQFDFHKAACDAAGYQGPLHQCSIYNSAAAGKKLGDMLSLGKSKPWPEAYKKLTGRSEMNATAVEEYFRPLYNWMQQQRKEKGYSLGWTDNSYPDGCDSTPTPVSNMTTSNPGTGTPTPTTRGGSARPPKTTKPNGASFLYVSMASILTPLLAIVLNH